MSSTSSESYIVTEMTNINGFYELTFSTLDLKGELHSLCAIIRNNTGRCCVIPHVKV